MGDATIGSVQNGVVCHYVSGFAWSGQRALGGLARVEWRFAAGAGKVAKRRKLWF
jgi:hypothetical protein